MHGTLQNIHTFASEHMHTINMYMHACTHSCMHTCMHTHTSATNSHKLFTSVESPSQNIPCKPSLLRPCTCSLSILAYSIASKSTCQVGGLWLWPPLHFVSPSCTAPSSSRGWLLKQASIACARNPSPSRTALPFFAAVLLTNSLKSMRCSWWSAEKGRPSQTHSS